MSIPLSWYIVAEKPCLWFETCVLFFENASEQKTKYKLCSVSHNCNPKICRNEQTQSDAPKSYHFCIEVRTIISTSCREICVFRYVLCVENTVAPKRRWLDFKHANYSIGFGMEAQVDLIFTSSASQFGVFQSLLFGFGWYVDSKRLQCPNDSESAETCFVFENESQLESQIYFPERCDIFGNAPLPLKLWCRLLVFVLRFWGYQQRFLTKSSSWRGI